jgi:hypothetical protein
MRKAGERCARSGWGRKGGGSTAVRRPSLLYKRRGVERRGGGGPAQARHTEESGEGSDMGVAHSEGGARWSRKLGAAGTATCGRRGRQRIGVACVGHACSRGPTEEGRSWAGPGLDEQ